jgi:hypothetical protein
MESFRPTSLLDFLRVNAPSIQYGHGLAAGDGHMIQEYSTSLFLSRDRHYYRRPSLPLPQAVSQLINIDSCGGGPSDRLALYGIMSAGKSAKAS